MRVFGLTSRARSTYRRGVAGLLTAVGLGAATAYALMIAGGGAADAAGTCTIYWTGATNATWSSTVTNWSLTDGGGSAGRVPTTTDFVCMSTAPVRPAVLSSTNHTV